MQLLEFIAVNPPVVEGRYPVSFSEFISDPDIGKEIKILISIILVIINVLGSNIVEYIPEF